MDLKHTVLGLELGSTRIKAVLLDETYQPIASGSHDWENQLEDGIWTYSMRSIHTGVQSCFAGLARDVEEKLGQKLTTVGAMGVSGMMHSYLPFDRRGKQLAPFRTWRNTITGQDPDCGGLISFNYYSGEHITGLNEGRPVFLRRPDSKFTLPNFMRTHLQSALAALKIGLDILVGEEKVEIDKLYGHGGFFKTPGVGQRILSAAAGVPVSVMETAGEGGPYGMALLAAYGLWKQDGQPLEAYLDQVFSVAKSTTLMAEEADIAGFGAFLSRYKATLFVERAAVTAL